MRLLTAAFTIAIAGCSAPSDGGANPETAASSEGPTASATLDPTGTWLVVRLDGVALDNIGLGHEPLITFTQGRIHFQSQCTYADWTFTQDGADITTQPFYEDGSAMCARGLSPSETTIQQAFTALDSLNQGTGGLLLAEGGGHKLELRKYGAEPKSAEVNLSGDWLVAEIDGRAINPASRLALKGVGEKLLWEPSCAGQFVNFQINGTRFETIPRDDTILTVCEIGYPPELLDAWASLNSADRIAPASGSGFTISGGGRSILLQRP